MVTRRVWFCVLVLAVVTSGATVSAALASSDVALGFGQRYVAVDGSEALHRGVDVTAQAGERVVSPVVGAVTFAGRVPVDAGQSVLAVTVASDRGKVTLSPFDTLLVSKGDHVSASDPLGTLAAAGDPSSAGPHVHLSLRLDDMYVDPTPLLEVPVAPSAPPVEPVEVPAAGAAPVMTPAPAPAAAPAAVPAPGAIAPGVTLASASGVPRAASAPRDLLSVAEPVRLAQGVSLTPARSTAQAPTSLARASLRRVTPVAWGAIGVAVAAVAAAAWAVFMLLAKRAVRARVLSDEPVSDRFGTMLQHMRSGDTLRGLTSCSGFSPSQSRGRLAQRR